MSYSVQSQFLPNWFVRRRALAIGIAFSGVGVGAILILPWLQSVILNDGWRSACWTLGHRDPGGAAADQPPRHQAAAGSRPASRRANGTDLTAGRRCKSRTSSMPSGRPSNGRCKRAVRTATLLVAGARAISAAGYIWYAVQVHQTKYLVEIGFSPMQAAWSLGVVAMAGIPGQILLGALSDRIGREIVWSDELRGLRDLLRRAPGARRRAHRSRCSTSWCCRRACWAMPSPP